MHRLPPEGETVHTNVPLYQQTKREMLYPNFKHWFPVEDVSDLDGYRVPNGLEGLRRIVGCYLGPRFLRDNPDLRNAFKTGYVHPENLAVPKAGFCKALQLKNIDALKRPRDS